MGRSHRRRVTRCPRDPGRGRRRHPRALLHYAPVPETLRGERLEIYPFLGSHLLAEAIDTVGADLVVHGHAHNGSERGVTPGGIRVRNVAQPVIQRAYRIYDLGEPTVREAPVAATG